MLNSPHSPVPRLRGKVLHQPSHLAAQTRESGRPRDMTTGWGERRHTITKALARASPGAALVDPQALMRAARHRVAVQVAVGGERVRESARPLGLTQERSLASRIPAPFHAIPLHAPEFPGVRSTTLCSQ